MFGGSEAQPRGKFDTGRSGEHWVGLAPTEAFRSPDSCRSGRKFDKGDNGRGGVNQEAAGVSDEPRNSTLSHNECNKDPICHGQAARWSVAPGSGCPECPDPSRSAAVL